jgi:tetratricopeptide (TPR) repeat protein
MGRRRESRRLLAEAVRLHVDDPERALEAIERAPVPLQRDPRTDVFLNLVTEGLIFKAQNTLRSSDPRYGIEMLRKIPRAAPSYAGAQLLIGDAYLRMRQPDEARRCYEAAREVDPKSFEASSGLARSLQIGQKYAEAAAAWSEVTSMRPDLSAPYVQLALCLMRLEKLDAARTACRKALEIDPNDRRAADLLKDLGKP